MTPLEAAPTPNLDALAKDSAQGRMIPVAPGITPGSGPGHLGLFGYDPLEFQVGRGVIEALGLGVELKPGDVCARANFATLDAKGIVTDRRAGRIPTETCEKLCAMLAAKVKKIGDTRGHHQGRQGAPLRRRVPRQGPGRPADRRRSEPRRLRHSRPSSRAIRRTPKQKKMAKLIADFYKAGPADHREGKAGQRLPHARHRPPARHPAVRGPLPAQAGVPRGLSDVQGPRPTRRHDEDRRPADHRGAVRALPRRIRQLRLLLHPLQVHRQVPARTATSRRRRRRSKTSTPRCRSCCKKKPDVLAITGDHSTPCADEGPLLASAAGAAALGVLGSDKLERFTETGANRGSLGVFEAKYLIRLMQANAKMFDKFGA